MTDAPRLSVIVPAHRSPHDLERCIGALRSSDLPAGLWELIVVDDGSGDDEAARVATAADRLITLPPPARGPAGARNAGAKKALADVVAFVDADVLVHQDALRRLLAAFDDATVSAVFGSYDDTPAASGLVSQYRNLLHHRVHQRNAGNVESFWAGCGAVRKSAFNAVGGFDADRYRRPEMEDVELGYRLRDAGHRIVLDPEILCTHLKRWTFPGMVSSDFTRRGIPWAGLLVERNMLLSPRGLSLGATERSSAALASLVVVAAAASVLCGSPTAGAVAAVLFVLFVIANFSLFAWLGEIRGRFLGLVAVPLHFAYSVTAVAGLVVGTLLALLSRRSARARYTRRR